MALLLQTEETQQLFRTVIEKYQFNLRKNAISIEAKKSDIDLTQPINIHLDIHQPLVYFDKNGELRGITADITQKICNIIEANCKITTDPTKTWQTLYTKLKNNEVDMLAPIILSEQRKALFNFTKIYHSSKVVVVKRYGYKNNVYQDLPELIMERVGAIKDDYFEKHYPIKN